MSLDVVQSGYRALQDRTIRANLRACQRLRCRSLQIHHRSKVEGSAEKFKKIERVTTGSVGPHDLLPSCEALSMNVLRQLGNIGLSAFSIKHCVIVAELKQSAIELDNVKFEVLKLKVLREAKRWQEEWIERSISSSKVLVESIRKMITDCAENATTPSILLTTAPALHLSANRDHLQRLGTSHSDIGVKNGYSLMILTSVLNEPYGKSQLQDISASKAVLS